jgi:glycosyltransferase involved in cell wall biosynthesis
MQASSPLLGRLGAEGVMVEALGGSWAPYDLRTVRKLRALIRAYDPDIVHGAVFEGVTMAALATLGLGAKRPKLVIEEIAFPVGRSVRGKLLFAGAARLADRVIAVSPAVRASLIEVGKIPAPWIRVIPNGVDAPEVPKGEALVKAREAQGLPEGAFVVGSLGRMHDVTKRFSDLIRATALLAPRLPELALLLVGGGNDIPPLKALARELGIEARVFFTGYREDVGAMYGLMDVFALVSVHESFGLVLAEAMRAGLPVICSGTGGMADVVVDGETGLFVGTFDPPRIAAAIERLYHDGETRRALGEAGHARAERLFASERYARDVAALYDELLRA